MPLLGHRLGLPYSQSSWFFGMGNLASVVVLFSLIKLTHRATDRALTLFFVAIGALAVGAIYTVTNFPLFLLVAALWGAANSLLGALGNMLMIHGTTNEQRGRYFCAMHMMYGFASLAAPVVVAKMVQGGLAFENAAVLVLPFLLLLAGTGWGLTKSADTTAAPTAHRLNAIQIWILVMFASYVAGEVLISSWMVTYLVDFVKLPMGQAASTLSAFFLLMGLSRAVCFLKIPPQWEEGLLWLSLILALVGALVGRLLWPPALALCGLVGPLFPLFMARASRVFPEAARSLTLWILGTIQLNLVASQWIMGRLADRFGVGNAFFLPNAFLVVSMVALGIYLKRERAHLKALNS